VLRCTVRGLAITTASTHQGPPPQEAAWPRGATASRASWTAAAAAL